MSIKSQKSLNEELSEIFEKSYSVRSDSEESASGSEDDDGLAQVLLRKLSVCKLTQLRRRFFRRLIRPKDDIHCRMEAALSAAAEAEGIQFSSAKGAGNQLSIGETEFIHAIQDIFESPKYSPHAVALFRALDPFGSGRAPWGRLVDSLAAAGALADRRADHLDVRVSAPRRLTELKHETLVRLVPVQREQSFFYVAVSRGGRAALYCGRWGTLGSYEVFYHRSGNRRRVKNCWITDAVYLQDAQMMLYSASDRSLLFFEASSLHHELVYCVTGLPDIPTCLAYSRCLGRSPSALSVGSERGSVLRLQFAAPTVHPLPRGEDGAVLHYCYSELFGPALKSFVSANVFRGVHARSVRRLAHSAGGARVLSSSHDRSGSLRLKRADGKLPDYVCHLPRGATCFQYSAALRLAVAGDAEGTLRVWEPTVCHCSGRRSDRRRRRSSSSCGCRPRASLSGPCRSPLADVAVIDRRGLILGYCAAPSLHIWDLLEECLLQTVQISFPFLGDLGMKVEFGPYAIHPGPATQTVCGSKSEDVNEGVSNNVDREAEEINPFDGPCVMLSCRSFVCEVWLKGGGRESGQHELLPPPPPPASQQPLAPLAVGETMEPVATDLSWATAGTSSSGEADLETLLNNAGLHGILEKNFALMRGLKHDLNQKLNDLEEASEDNRGGGGCVCPHRSLRLARASSGEMEAQDELELLQQRYLRVMKLFPSASRSSTASTTPRTTDALRTTI